MKPVFLVDGDPLGREAVATELLENQWFGYIEHFVPE